MNAALHIPGMANLWVQPIRNRIDMLSTGIKSPGRHQDRRTRSHSDRTVGSTSRPTVKDIPGTRSAFAERVRGGRYVEICIDRVRAARFGLSRCRRAAVVAVAIGGENVGETVEGLQRFPINVRYPRELRDSVENLQRAPDRDRRAAPRRRSAPSPIVEITDGPPRLHSENARLNGWVYVDISGRDLGGMWRRRRSWCSQRVNLPAGYTMTWSGQFEYLERATKKLRLVVPFTSVIIFVLLYLTFEASAGEPH